MEASPPGRVTPQATETTREADNLEKHDSSNRYQVSSTLQNLPTKCPLVLQGQRLIQLLSGWQDKEADLGKYPDIVTLQEGLQGDYITLRNPLVSGLELLIVWKIHMDEEGRTTPVLDLLTKVPEQVLEHKMVTLRKAPRHFRSLLLLLGVEAAIENLIRVVGLRE
ncbi:centromere protein P-like [Cuculus canorus]|uniref:centromere protein P-like n=1 Tax=Cuculus canorus TaxID=55661 RepID=UPI0023AAC45B|nr:centromere protein P-like [Cuculus canorus]